jgi:pyruvate dehydrogenase E2 component (dihydrolipoamide acetyltransferase)
MTDVTMPQLGETVTEGTITRWAKAIGDTVAVDEVLFEVSTDKVDSEVPSPAAGVLSEIVVQEGETADVGAVLARLGEAGSGGGDNGAAPAAEAPAPAAQPEAEPAPETTATNVTAAEQEDAAINAGTNNSRIATGAGGSGSGSGSGDGPGLGGRVLSPVVRKLINDNNLNVDNITGTGAGGRITREDVEKVLSSGVSVIPEKASAAHPGPSGSAQQAPQRATPPSLPPAQAGERDMVVPFSKIRQKTAEHMIMSKQTSAHTLVTIEVDYANVDKVRKAQKDKFKQEEGTSLTYLPFITRAVVDALAEFPYANASVGTNELIVHRDVNVGIAVDLNFEGLLVPVVRNADGLRLRQIARGIADLASRARGKKLQADDITGGTFTITNAGGYGTFVTYPVINQPQVAILSTDGVKKRPVVIELPDGTDAIVAHPVGMLGLAWDHRAFDGAYASAFLAKIKDVLETRDWANEI